MILLRLFVQSTILLSTALWSSNCFGKSDVAVSTPLPSSIDTTSAPRKSSDVKNALIKEIERYFNSIDMLFADFKQLDKNGSKSCGYLMMKNRNLKMEYTTPPANIMIIKDQKVTFYDKELDEKTKTTAHSSPFSFLLRRKTNLRENLEILDLHDNETEASLTFRCKNDDSDGSSNDSPVIRMHFSKKPFSLLGWEIFSSRKHIRTGFSTKIRLLNHNFRRRISDSEFDVLD